MSSRKQLCSFNVWIFTTALLICVQPSKAEHSCGFDYGLCSGWSQNYQDDFDWTNEYGSTLSYNTGPSSGHGGYGSYMYIETSLPRQYGDSAKLEYSVSSSDLGKLSCLKFYYHMYGDTINTLNVYNGNTTMFRKSGNQGSVWLKAKISMTLQSKVTFEGISGTSYTGDIAIDDVSIVDGICQECKENVNQSFGRLDISYKSDFDPYCNWIVGHAGTPQAVAIVSIHQLYFGGSGGEYIKIFGGNGTEVFALQRDSVSFNKSLLHIAFGESRNITIQVSLVDRRSYVKITYGILKRRLNLASLLADWNVTVVNKTAKSIGIIWSNPSNLLSGGIRFYVVLARKTNSSSVSTGEIVAENTTTSQITGLDEYTEYTVGVVAVNGNGIPFKSEDVLIMTDEGVPSRAPNGVRVSNVEFASDLLVEWNPLPQYYANGKLLGYRIYYKENDDYWSPYKSVNTSSHYPTQFALKGLKIATRYVIAVAAYTSRGEGPRSKFEYAITGCFTTLNETFGQIVFTTTSNYDLQCNWEIHNAGIRYAVAFIAVQELNLYYCSEYVKIIEGNGTEVLHHTGCKSFTPKILADVPFGISNNISIQVNIGKRGNSIKLKYAILKKGLTSAILVSGWNATIVNLSSNSFALQWTKLNTVVNHYAQFYLVEVKSTQGTILTVDTVPGDTKATVIKRLRPSTKYHVSIFGVDGIGQPYKSLETVTTTKKASCGSRPSTTRIVGGTVAPVNSWPWQVMVTDSYGSQFCGGSLVDRYWVVTAAHCMARKTPSSVKIRLGAHYRTQRSVGTEQDIGVAKIIMHENYNSPLKYSNDIALINLVRPADLGEEVGLVCLPDTGHHLPFDNVNKKCWITGWGSLSSWGSSPNTLRQASVPLVSKQRCASAFPSEIDDSMLCAGLAAGGIDTCSGDSGGPLVCEFNGTWYLEGVTSWGYGCAQPGKYGMYANVRNLKSWLLSNMYDVVAPSPSPQNQSSSALVWCSFDNGLCSGWKQCSSDDFDWTLASGSTPSSSTGPTYSQGDSGNYMYIEASSPRKPGENAKLVVTVPINGRQSCISLYYHMYGASAGTFNVYSGNTKVFSVSGNQGNNWLAVQRNLYLNGLVTFEGIVGSSYTGDIAIDQVKITEGSCSASCSFDSGLCFGWSQSISDVFDWTLHSGSTPSWSTGPSSDLSGAGKYMYIEASSQSPGDNAKLQLAAPGSKSSACLTFYYHMYGRDMGTLNVFNGNVTIFNMSGDQGNYWRKVTRTVNLSHVLTFEGIVGSSFESDIAIDNVTVSEGDCPVAVSCDFDSGLCGGWRQSNSDVFNWTRHTGSTPSFSTGPDGDHTSGLGSYMYIETSWPRVAGDNAKLELAVSGNGELSCLEFYYHMYGDTMGTLTVFSGNVVVFNMSGNHGKSWIKAEITIHLNNTVTFEGITGWSYTSDLAIDDVSINNGSCQGHTATATFPRTSTFAPSLASSPSLLKPSLETSAFNPSTVKLSSSPSALAFNPSTAMPSSSVSSTFKPSTVKPLLYSGPSIFKPSLLSISSSHKSSLPSSVLSDNTFEPTTSKSTLIPRTPSIEETQNSVVLEVQDLDIKEWNEQMEVDFKRVVARVATDYCAADRTRCLLTTTSSRRTSSTNKMEFTSEMVHILPGYPKKSPEDPLITLLAFYLHLPQGFSENVLRNDVLKAIVENDVSSIEESLRGTILLLRVHPSSSIESAEESDEESQPTTSIIGGSVGGVLLLVIISALVLAFKKSNRFINRRAKKADIGNKNNAFFDNAYFINSKEEAIEMKCGESTYSSSKVPDIKPEEHCYATINDLRVSTNHSAVVLKFPGAYINREEQ
ncbi:MAM and LDL-receptor class A domain-containing protein 2-like [Oculina patagonica]